MRPFLRGPRQMIASSVPAGTATAARSNLRHERHQSDGHNRRTPPTTDTTTAPPLTGQHEPDAHDAQVVVDPHWRPSTGGLVDLLVHEAQHARDAGAADVDVQQTDGAALGGEGERQLRGEGRLPHAALAREDEHLVLHARQPLGDQRDGCSNRGARRRQEGLTTRQWRRAAALGAAATGPGEVRRRVFPLECAEELTGVDGLGGARRARRLVGAPRAGIRLARRVRRGAGAACKSGGRDTRVDSGRLARRDGRDHVNAPAKTHPCWRRSARRTTWLLAAKRKRIRWARCRARRR